MNDLPTPRPGAAAVPPPLHPLLQRLLDITGGMLLPAEAVAAWCEAPGLAMLVFTEDPERFKETLDLAVIVPELHAAAGRAFRVGLLAGPAARAAAPRWGFVRWPAFVMLRDGGYLGAVDGLRDWADYVQALQALMAAPAGRAPGIGVAVVADDAASTPGCA